MIAADSDPWRVHGPAQSVRHQSQQVSSVVEGAERDGRS